ncbi:hypothetical protein GCM10007063_31720 [Lentibacillus kapialis]|uniref:Uncharacterized protein n=1 Tax=Lentibacillus kapialis TaxID=340214 RepID=A0A917V117_9BACI|nr:hypothetical protein [Lentibacillus kapialis]GGK06830.1 hypothetical protein GCM10007063_31720 [Lentibacillus kapialis]
MQGNDHSITVTEQLLDSEDFSGKKGILKRHTEKINECDMDFFKRVDSIIVNEDQKGKIIDSMLDETKKLKRQNLDLIEDVNQQINKTVAKLNEQAEEMKTQRMTIRYRDNI